jgi:hypothetical protein
MPPVGPRSPTPPTCGRPDLGRRLADWDLLEPRERTALEAHAATCPRCGPALDLLRRADAWLAAGSSAASVGSCPDTERLYDAAGGPGARPLDPGERATIEEHLARCAECAGFAATLDSRPPSPLLLDPDPGPRPTLEPLPASLPRRRLRLVPALAAAAGLVLAVAVWRAVVSPGTQAQGPEVASAPRFPAAPLLRGDLTGPLLYPRIAVLARAGGELVHPLGFEIQPQEGASAYRVLLFGGTDEEPVLRTEAEAAHLTAVAERLEPGRYTWEAWAVVHGLDVPLGRRDFEVRHDAELLAELERWSVLPEPERSERTLALLVERGFASDARAWARGLPASPERDAFLGRTPGR